MATRMAGLAAMCLRPITASTTNHTTVIGPKNLPMPPVPCFWMANSIVSTTSVTGVT